MRSVQIVLFLLLFYALPCWSAEHETLPPPLQQGLTDFNQGLLLEAYDAFAAYHKENPGDPRALFYEAMSKWKMMWLASYNPQDRGDLIALLHDAEDAYEDIADRDSDSLFYYASVIGLRAQLAATDGDWWGTAQLGKKMKKSAEKLLKQDPEYYDADYLLGSFNYFADTLPGHVKFFRALLFLPGGDRKAGLEQLNTAYQKGKLTNGEAGRTLSIIYTYFEHSYEDGRKLCDTILTNNPDAFDVGLYKGIDLYFSNDWEDAITWMQQLHERLVNYSEKHRNSHQQPIVPVYLPIDRELHYWIARCMIQQKKYEAARELLVKLADPELHQPWWLMRGVFLSLAQIDYIQEHPEDAEKRIKRVMDWPDAKDSHDKAKLLQKKKADLDDPYAIDFKD